MGVTVRQKEKGKGKGKGKPWWGHLWISYVVLLSSILLFFAIFILHSKPLFGFTPSDNAKWWKSLTNAEQGIYITGLRDGYEHCNVYDIFPILDGMMKNDELSTFYNKLESESPFLRHMYDIDIEVMKKNISELYKDPANTYIEPFEILCVAIDKIEGKSIEAKLQELREGPWRLKKRLEDEKRNKK
jgi:hypothetical protein